MVRTVRQISIVFFCSVYLAVSLAGLIGTLRMPSISHGPQAVASAAANTKEKPRIVQTQRHLIPSVKTFTVPIEAGCTIEIPSEIRKHSIVPQYSYSSALYHSSYFFSVGDRAPPIA